MKKILAILCICLISIFSAGCDTVQTEKVNVNNMFTLIDDGVGYGITI